MGHLDNAQGYMSGGAGYVLSREALHRLVDVAFGSRPECGAHMDVGHEDVLLGICLALVDVRFVDARDRQLKGRFMPLPLEQHLNPLMDPQFWYWSYRYYGTGSEVCIYPIQIFKLWWIFSWLLLFYIIF